jgi:hypothetical protein
MIGMVCVAALAQEDTGALLQALLALDRADDVRSLVGKLALRA